MICRQCGQEIKDNSRFCPKCGATTPTSTEGSPEAIKDNRLDNIQEQEIIAASAKRELPLGTSPAQSAVATGTTETVPITGAFHNTEEFEGMVTSSNEADERGSDKKHPMPKAKKSFCLSE